MSLSPQVRATSKPESESAVDIVFVQCKAAHTKQAVMGARNMFKQVEGGNYGFIRIHDNDGIAEHGIHLLPKWSG